MKQQMISRAVTTLPRIRDGRKEQVEEILSLADVKIDGRREWDISVHDHRFYARVLRRGSLGLGESYVDGWWDCAALDQLFSRILAAELDQKASWNWRLMLDWLVAAALNRQTRFFIAPRLERTALFVPQILGLINISFRIPICRPPRK